MTTDTLRELGYSGDGFYELKIRLSADEFARLSRVADRHALGRVELLQHLLRIADESLAEHDVTHSQGKPSRMGS